MNNHQKYCRVLLAALILLSPVGSLRSDEPTSVSGTTAPSQQQTSVVADTAIPAAAGNPAAAPVTGASVSPAISPAISAAAAVDVQDIRKSDGEFTNFQANGDFAAQLWLINRPDVFWGWKKGEHSPVVPEKEMQRNQTLFTAIFFQGARADVRGYRNVAYDIGIKRPDGSMYGLHRNVVGWNGLPATPDRLSGQHPMSVWQPTRDYVSIHIDPTDPSGVYQVEALVRDNVGQVTVPLKTSFTVW